MISERPLSVGHVEFIIIIFYFFPNTCCVLHLLEGNFVLFFGVNISSYI